MFTLSAPNDGVKATVSTKMFVPPELDQLVVAISRQVGCELAIVRCWQSDGGRPVLYANVRGTLNDSPHLVIEIAGTVCAELTTERDDEISLFLFVNGQRVGLHDQTYKYLIGNGSDPLLWACNDEGFDEFTTLDESTFLHPIDESLIIPEPSTKCSDGGG